MPPIYSSHMHDWNVQATPEHLSHLGVHKANAGVYSELPQKVRDREIYVLHSASTLEQMHPPKITMYAGYYTRRLCCLPSHAVITHVHTNKPSPTSWGPWNYLAREPGQSLRKLMCQS